METTLVSIEGKGTNPKTTLYVGGLEESVNDASLHAAFIPFGDIKDVNIPLDHASGKNRGWVGAAWPLVLCHANDETHACMIQLFLHCRSGCTHVACHFSLK